ncbi:MAG TPA: hypothetical protein VE732_08420, partial [Nitrososphaera sp.]|nr:hypothetical protein [Nitrososphaera sp.]
MLSTTSTPRTKKKRRRPKIGAPIVARWGHRAMVIVAPATATGVGRLAGRDYVGVVNKPYPIQKPSVGQLTFLLGKRVLLAKACW